MNRKGILALIVVLQLALAFALTAFAEDTVSDAEPPIEVVASSLERAESGRLGWVPFEEDMLFLCNSVTDSSAQFSMISERQMRYSLSYTMEGTKTCLIRLALTGPDGAVERENTLPLGDAEGENSFEAIILTVSGAKGEYTAALYIDDILTDTVTFSD